MEKPFRYILENKWLTLFSAAICMLIGFSVLFKTFMPIFAIPIIFCALAIDFVVMDSLIPLTSGTMEHKKRICLIGFWLFSFVLCIANIFICIIVILIESDSEDILRIPPCVVFVMTGIAFALTALHDIKNNKKRSSQNNA